MDLERVFFFLKAPVLFFWSVGLGAEPEDRINGGSLITGAVVAILGAVLCLATNPLQPWSFVIAYITGFLAFDEERPWWMYCYYALFASGYVIVSIVTALWRLSGG